MKCKRLKFVINVSPARPLSANIDYTTIATQRNRAVNEKMRTLVQGRSKAKKNIFLYTVVTIPNE
ncbi:hypothetical protein PAT3040_02632 [Paenibacillus agaridevorans]|uniref:Uncharacterized protein n=1 Tax=Paenibacillus agaridevorans TaxID=171404 RepID=A0A2R5EPP4_9BACL|nr:hypothetical protein PAT3040_02632 [Paenibacillus agaridevorans]